MPKKEFHVGIFFFKGHNNCPEQVFGEYRWILFTPVCDAWVKLEFITEFGESERG